MNGVRDVVHVLLSSAATKAFTQQLMDELQLNEVLSLLYRLLYCLDSREL